MTETCFGVGGLDQAREDRTINVERIVATFKMSTKYDMAAFIVSQENNANNNNCRCISKQEKKEVAVRVIVSEKKKTAVPRKLMMANGVRTCMRMV